MAINALNCGANVWLADLEDANTPHWRNVVGGQVVLKDAVRRTLSFTSPDGKEYRLREDGDAAHDRAAPARLAPARAPPARRRRSRRVGALVDAGLYLFHNAQRAARPRQRAVLLPAQDGGPPRGAALGAGVRPRRAGARPPGRLDPRHDADRDHPGRLRDGGDAARARRRTPPRSNAGRWDYLFSVIKVFRDAGPEFVLPDRGAVTMTAPMMRAYTEQLVAVCHRRGALAIGGMAAAIPSRRDAEANERGAGQGARGQDPRGRRRLRRLLGGAPRPGRHLPRGVRRRAGRPAQPARPAAARRARHRGAAARRRRRRRASGPWPGCGPTSRWRSATWRPGSPATARSAIHGLMEDAATAEISRSQVWQWINAGVVLDTGETVTEELVRRVDRRGGGAASASCESLDDARPAVRAGGARRRVPRLPDPARLRASVD